MKLTLNIRLLAALFAMFIVAIPAMAQPIGQWDFESGDLRATAGTDLQYLDGAGGATQTGTAFGTTTALGIPNIGGAEAKVMKFPANVAPQGYLMNFTADANGGGSLVNQWTIVFDVLYPTESAASWRAFIETDGRQINADADFFVNPTGGIGIATLYHGKIEANTWYRIGFVVDAAANQIRKYINGQEVGRQSATSGGTAALDGRWALSPATGAELFNDDDGDVAVGFVNSIQLRNVALSSAQMLALAGPTAAGIPVDLPPVPSFVERWIPSGPVATRTTDIGAVINTGDSVVSGITIKLDGNALANPSITTAGSLITAKAANPGPFAPGSKHTIELSYQDSRAGSKTFTREFTAAIFFEDFDGLTLLPNKEEASASEAAWTHTPPAGWRIDNSQFPATIIGPENPDDDGDGFADLDGRTEWAGWSFASRDWWPTVDNQTRADFTLGTGIIAIADPDEWDDANHIVSLFNSFLITPELSLDGIPANTLYLKFFSSWRPEGFDDANAAKFPVGPNGEAINNQTALITISYDGGAPQQILKWDSKAGSATFHPDSQNETVLIRIDNPAGARKAVVSFALLEGANDWWWAVDNIEVNGGALAPIISVQPVSEIASFGGNVTFSVTAAGTEPLGYQWRFGGQNIANATGSTLTLNNVQLEQAGEYDVVISNIAGSVTSAKASLQVFIGPITQDLVAHLSFDNTLNDFSGRQNHGLPVGSPTFSAGQVGTGALHIPSGADYVTLGTPVDLNFGLTTDFTIAFWAKLNTWTDDPSFIGNKNWNSGGNPGYVLSTDNDGHYQWNLAGPPGTRKDYDGPAGTFSDHAWHHIVTSFDRDGFARSYVDGVFLGSASMAQNQNNLDTPEGLATNIGQDGTGAYGPSFTDADLDDMGIWRRTLTSHEVAAIYAAGRNSQSLVTSISGPSISVHPTGGTVPVGSPVTLSVTATGSGTLNYVWLKDGTAIPGATGASYVIGSAKVSDSGKYKVEVKNMAGAVLSQEATLTVTPARDLSEGMVVHLTFDGHLNDSTSRANNGTAKGNTPFVPGKIGSAVRVTSAKDGSSFNYVSLGAPADLNFGTATDFTVSFWAKLTTWEGDPAFVSNKDWNSGGNQGWVIATAGDGRIQWNIADGDAGGRTRKDYDSAGGVFNDRNWHHVAVTFERAGNAKTYVDGVKLAETAITPGIDSIDTPAGLATNIGQDGRGTYTDGNSVGIDGQVDDLGIWTRALSAEDVAEIYRKGQAGVDIRSKVITDDLVVHMTFDSDLTDSSGRGNHGTGVGSTSLVAGKVGSKALHYSSAKDGTSFNYVSLGAPADLNFGTSTDFTVSFWAKIANWEGDPAFVSNKDWNSGGNQGWVIATAGDGRIQWNIADGDAGGRTRKDYDSPGGKFNDGNWHHVAVTFSRLGNAITYLDGAAIATTSISTGLDSVDTPAGLATNIGQDGRGTYTDGNSVGITDGNIDDVGIWRRVLSASEVASIYTKGQAGINFRSDLPPSISSVTSTGGAVTVVWSGTATTRLQTSDKVVGGTWQEVPNSLGASSATVTVTGTTAFFRLVRQ